MQTDKVFDSFTLIIRLEFIIPFIFAFRMKKQRKFVPFFLLFLVIVAAFVVYNYSVVQPQKKAKRALAKKEVVIPFDPHFNPLPKGYRHQFYDSIESFFYKRLQLEAFHGMFLVAKNGEIIFERYQGVANEQTKLRFSPETPVHVASISKTITSVTVLRLVDRDSIRLDEDIRTYLPAIPYSGITVRMLLNHRSGIPYYGYFTKEMCPPTLKLTNQGVLDILKKYHPKLYFPSNTQFSYCNTNYALLALIIEKVTGKPYSTVVQELIFDPLKMKHSFIMTANVKNDNRALSYNSKGVFQEETNLDGVYGDKNLYTTVRDLLRFDKGTYSSEFLSKAMKREMYKGYSYETPGKANYGLGIRIREEQGKSTFFFHTGWWHGNTACYASMRSDTVCMILLSNHYTRKVFGINSLSLAFGNYPFASLDPMDKTASEGKKEE